MTNYEYLKNKMAQPEKVGKLECDCPSFDFEVLETITSGGSEKQIEWAKYLYEVKVREFSSFARHNEKSFKDVEKIKSLFEKIFNNDNAKYWIDNQKTDIMELLKTAMEVK